MAALQIIPSLNTRSAGAVSWEPTSDAMTNQQSLINFGFKFGRSGAHDSRTMMLLELRSLFACTQSSDGRPQYREQITELNCLDKPTNRARKLTAEHLVDLYGLSPDIPLFRVFRQLWDVRVEAQPLLALQLAVARDPLFRVSVPLMLELQPGEPLQREQTEAALAAQDPNRFSPASLKSYAQNINGSWTQAGFLRGRAKKSRAQPQVTEVNVAYALFQAYLNGLSGQRLFSSEWCKLLDCRVERLIELARTASLRGLITFKQSGEVIEVGFPDFLTATEKAWLHE
ncbi:TPA: hypothetical protein VDV13_005798 [Pseudomonas aeruginosa]|jgi:hypothetical protein|nr:MULTISPECIES: hypothetical protein [Pseudomonas]EIU7167789.1 hypothetical protein [Pseudomonas aeruginosa]EKN0218088.1 hypothetical protein [Pseudomonas aeruginosa]EKT8169852.1 hypothetical protein [Pseudomonas aeruginosa]EKU9997767.1 hypothetical protein [Pseudomonas aeruginosa]EKV0010316.1 hypothetical protein [Pseudomonas aeruginosa]